MLTVLVCATPSVESDLSHTLFWRDDLERYVAGRAEDAAELALTAEPQVVVVDLALSGAGPLIASLQARAGAEVTIVALSHRASDVAETVPAAGRIHTVLPLPSSPAWDESLVQVLQLPARKQPRYGVRWGLIGARPGHPGTHCGLALNVSAGGLLAECPGLEAGLGDDVAFSLAIPGRESPVEGQARVVRNPLRDHFGLRFEGFADDGEARVCACVAALAAAPASPPASESA
jgi:hypothetical protein